MLRKWSKIIDFSPKSIQKFFERLFGEFVNTIFHFRWDKSIAHGFAAREGSEPLCGMIFRHPGVSKIDFSLKFPWFSWDFLRTFLNFSSDDIEKFCRIGAPGSRRYQNYYQTPCCCGFRALNVSTTILGKSLILLILRCDSLAWQTVTPQFQNHCAHV